MDDQKIDLALAFIESKPDAAAGILEQQPIKDVANFLNNVPHTHVALIAEKMLPQYIAKLCPLLDTELCAGFLSRMTIDFVAAVFRHSKKEMRMQILDLLPEKTKIICKILLNYPEDSVGAWMIANITVLPNDCSVGDALKIISSQEINADNNSIYVIDRERVLQGLINTASLLQADIELPITSIMQSKPDTLHSRSSLSSVISHNEWSLHDTLPVVNRNNQLVGMLRHVDLRKGLNQISNSIESASNNDSFTNILKIYGSSLLAIFNTVGEMLNTRDIRR